LLKPVVIATIFTHTLLVKTLITGIHFAHGISFAQVMQANALSAHTFAPVSLTLLTPN
jgi:hypothetical protein